MPSNLNLDYYYGNEAEQYSFYRVPKTLLTDPRFKGVSIEAKVLYGLLLDRMGLSVRNGWMDSARRIYIYFTQEDAMTLMNCGKDKATKEEVSNTSLRVILTYIYSHTYGDFTDAGNARGLEHWGQYWSDIWFMVAQAMSWYYEHGIILDVNSNREAFIEQASEEFVAAMKLYHQTYGQSSWITNWDNIGTHSIIDSADGGVTGLSAYDYVSTGVNLVLDHPEYFHDYHLWIYEWDNSQPWMLPGQSGVPMQRLLIAVPDDQPSQDIVKLTIKKLEAGTNKPIPGVTFKIESADGSGDFSITRETGEDGTITLTSEADGLSAGQYTITEESAPDGYVAQTASQVVTVMPNNSISNTFTFYNTPNKPRVSRPSPSPR